MKRYRIVLMLLATLILAGCSHKPLKAPCPAAFGSLFACNPQPFL